MAKYKDLQSVGDLGAGWDSIIEELNTEPSHRALVVLTIGYLDDLLGAMLKQRFVPNRAGHKDPAKGELPAARAMPRSMEARLDLCFALGLVNDDIYHDVAILGKIRNRFAHAWRKLDLGSPDVAKMVHELRFARQVFPQESLTPRALFSTTAIMIVTHLILQAHQITPLSPASCVPMVRIDVGESQPDHSTEVPPP
jgi:DNA-binding MltR family transcriptional regulator